MTCVYGIEDKTAFKAFELQLKTLCLNEFPCGVGSWSENYGKKPAQIERDKTISRYPITHKDYGVNFEKTETLEELITTKKSPWNLDYSWSNEAKELREIAVRSPWLISKKFILDHFRTLRIVNRNVTEIDHHLLQFNQLEELSLSANKLRSVNSRNLPPNLTVLELCANEISDLGDLCIRPPALLHLGLGHNRLIVLDDYITGVYWPKLLSLDLGHNDLSSLVDVVNKLQSLPKLRNLILQGNPLALVPGYRGYTVDSLRSLLYLDDSSISADEKHHYKGLSKRKEYILDEAIVQLHVSHIKGIPVPEEILHPDMQPEYPIITRKFYIQFKYLKEKSAEAEILKIENDEQPLESPNCIQESHRDLDETRTESREQDTALASPEVSEQPLEQPIQADIPSSANHIEAVAEDAQHKRDDADDVEQDEIKLCSIETDSFTWQEEILLNWTNILVRDDLLALRNFIKKGMTINVVERKVLSYPADQVQDGVVSPILSQKSKDKKGKKDDKNKEKAQKEEKKDDKKKDKKKKGEPDIDMVDLPPQITNLATFHMSIKDLIEGEFVIEETFLMEMTSTDSTGTEEPEDEKVVKKKLNSAKKPSEKDKGKDKGASQKAPNAKKEDKANKGKKGAHVQIDDGDEPPQPPPLEFYVRLSLHHWKTAIDSMKSEPFGNVH